MLNYNVIIQYLTEQLNFQNQQIAEWLNIHHTTISKIRNNNANLPANISAELFYKDVFLRANITPDFQSVYNLYTYLQDKDCSDEVIDMAYSNCKKHQSDKNAETFLRTVLTQAKQNAKPLSKPASKSTHRSPSDAIAFEPFHNPIQNNTFFGRQDMF